MTDTQHHHPTHCDVCGEPLDADCAPKVTTSWIEIDIAEQVEGQPALRFKVTEHLMYSHTCPNGHTTRAKAFVARDDPLWEKVAVGEWRLVGPMLAALIVYMALSM